MGLIRDEDNMEAPLCGPRFDMKPLSENLAKTVELAKGADTPNLEPTDTTLVEFAPGTSRASSSS